MNAVAATPTADSSLTVIEDATCTYCGCVCDDIDLSVRNNRIVAAKRACVLGEPWFLNQVSDGRPSCLIDGKSADLADGIERAARILSTAKYPLIYGLGDTTCEAQRVAVGIGDWIGGIVDTTTSVFQGPAGMAFQGVGEVTCSLGEMANRGDFILFWGSDPSETHPRHFSKYSLLPKGMFVPGGRSDRFAVLVDARKTKTAEEMNDFYQIKPGKDFEALWTLRAIAKGVELDPRQVREDTGVELGRWQALVDRMKAAKFGVILFGTENAMSGSEHVDADAIWALVRDMNAYTRFAARPLRGRGNVAGADNVLSWQTGYLFGVNLSRGYPRFNPGEYTANDTLSRGEVDAAMIVACDPITSLGQAARERLSSIPLIAIDSQETSTKLAATVAFTTATYGIHVPGTVYRMDDVPIPLRPALRSPHPSDFEVLSGIEKRVRELMSPIRI